MNVADHGAPAAHGAQAAVVAQREQSRCPLPVVGSGPDRQREGILRGVDVQKREDRTRVRARVDVDMPGSSPCDVVLLTLDGEVDADQAVVGSNLAGRLGLSEGDTVTLTTPTGSRPLTVTGVYTSGDSDDDTLYAPLAVVQELTGHIGQVDQVEVKALTTPENDLSRKAAQNPAILSSADWETWYCTAYASSIAYQIEEAIPGAVAKQVRQVAAVEGNVLEKTQTLMILMTALSLVAAVLAVASLTTASLVERTGEFALLKAIGASSASVNRLILAETAVLGLAGTAVGALVGSGLAQLIGRIVFGSSITMRPMVYVLVVALISLVLLVATASSMRSILKIQPATALHRR